MGSFDGAEVSELVGLFLLNNLSEKYGKNKVGLYRDDELVLLRNTNGRLLTKPGSDSGSNSGSDRIGSDSRSDRIGPEASF